MTLTRGLGVLLSLLLLATPLASLGADGDRVTTIDPYSRGHYIQRHFFLCDGATGGATKTCGEFDTNQSGLGLPVLAVVYIDDNDTGCSGTPTATVRGFNEASATVKHEENGGTALTTSGDTAVVLSPPVWRYYDATIATGTGCTDLEVIITLFYERGLF